MEVLFLFVPLSMLVVAGLVWAAFWAIRNNQYEDLEGPAHRILMDDDDPKIPTNQSAEETDAPRPRRMAGRVTKRQGSQHNRAGNNPDWTSDIAVRLVYDTAINGRIQT